MAWFSVWLPLVSQLAIPVALLAWVAFGHHATKARLTVVVALAAIYSVAIYIAGLWLVLPWWLPFLYGAAGAWAMAHRLRGGRAAAPRRLGAWNRVVTALIGTLAAIVLVVVGVALASRRPSAEPVDVMFPLETGTYLVLNGGSRLLTNAHLGTLEGERFAPYRGQSHGVDLVRINRAGLRVPGLLPADPAAYFIYGDPVLAPCRGHVVFTQDGVSDMPPPQVDRAHMAGNHVIVECGSAWIVLGHLQPGSVAVRAGQATEPGDLIGRVGNSGNTGEPHLHVHAQRPGSPVAPLSGEPIPMRLSGRYLVRNDRVHPDVQRP